MELSTVKIEVYLPEDSLDALREALDQAGLCRVGTYSHVMAVLDNRGYWKPLAGSQPFLGAVGELCSAPEVKAEFPCPSDRVKDAIRVIRKVHPYEEPVFYVLPVLNELFEE